jgi:quercetin dioxygenase-like cupin family protein
VEYRRGRSEDPAEPGENVCATTGDVLIDNVLSEEGIAVNSAMFRPGSHTYWHSHESGQLFMVHSGRGMIAVRDGEAQVVQAGDVVYTPPGEEHWHGAAPDCFVAYTSVSLGTTHLSDDLPTEDYENRWNAPAPGARQPHAEEGSAGASSL